MSDSKTYEFDDESKATVSVNEYADVLVLSEWKGKTRISSFNMGYEDDFDDLVEIQHYTNLLSITEYLRETYL